MLSLILSKHGSSRRAGYEAAHGCWDGGDESDFSFLQLAKGCLGREKHINSTRCLALMTWEKELETQCSIEQGHMLKTLTLNHPMMMCADKVL